MSDEASRINGQIGGRTKGSTQTLTPKQRRFVAEYLVDLNATQAAIRAGYSARTARQQASDLLMKPDIAAAVAAGQATQLERADLTAVATKEAVRRQVCGDIRRLFDEHGNFKAIHTLSADEAALIAGFEVIIKNAEGGDGHTDRVLRVRLKDQAPFVQMAMKHLGLLTDKLEVEHRMTLEDLVAGSRQGQASLRER